MKGKFGFVDCEAIKLELETILPDVVKVIRVWEGTRRSDKTYNVYVRITEADDDDPLFTEVVLNDMKATIGELMDVEIIDWKTLEFGFALPLSSPYCYD